MPTRSGVTRACGVVIFNLPTDITFMEIKFNINISEKNNVSLPVRSYCQCNLAQMAPMKIKENQDPQSNTTAWIEYHTITV